MTPYLIPQPKSVQMAVGSLTLTRRNKIIATHPTLVPVAKVLASEVMESTGVSMDTGTGKGSPGDIILRLDSRLRSDEYVLTVADTVLVLGKDDYSVGAATSTFLQLLRVQDRSLTVPKCEIKDIPFYPFRGLLLDLARKYHTPQGIKQVITLCRFYKIRYLHLHLTDDQLFMFPSTAFPQIGKSNQEFARFEPAAQPHTRPYTKEELVDLERYAKARGVMLVPELDLPGHSGRLISDAHDAFGIPGNGSTVHIARAKTITAVTQLMHEVIDIFQSTPYIHLGADEVGLGGLDQTQEYKDLHGKDDITSVHALYCKFIRDLGRVITSRGKKVIVWEEAYTTDTAFPLPKDTVVMVWSQSHNPNDIVKNGYSVINATWTPLYIVRDNKKSLEFLFNWTVPQFGREGSDEFTPLTNRQRLLGAQLCSWENSENIEIQSIRDRLALVAERCWNPETRGTFAAFKRRLAHTDAILEKLIHPVKVQVTGTFTTDENTFTSPLEITLTPSRPNLIIRYTTDNTLPNPTWKTYLKPLQISQTVHLRAGLFDRNGRQYGPLTGAWYRSKIAHKPNLATGKPVRMGPSQERKDGWFASIAVDGHRDDPGAHWAPEGAGPQWLEVDLLTVQAINFINVVTYWDGNRSYQWTAESSLDGTTWTQFADFSRNIRVASDQGYPATFPARQARYVRVHMLKNSANPFVHIVELILDYKK